MSFGQWVCVVELDLDEHETAAFVAGVKAFFGAKARTTTKARWLVDAEKQRPPAMGKPAASGSVQQVRLRQSVGARDKG